MAAPPFESAPYYKDIVHNLGYNPIVRATALLSTHLFNGWVKVPIQYYVQEFDEFMGLVVVGKELTYEYLDENTIRFYGEQGIEIDVDLFIEPRKDAWYE